MVTFYTEELLVSKLTNLLNQLSGNLEKRCSGPLADLQGSFRGQGQLNWVWFCGAVAACLTFVLVAVDLHCWTRITCYTFFAAFPVAGLLAFQNYCNCFWCLPTSSISLTLSGLILVESCLVYPVNFKSLSNINVVSWSFNENLSPKFGYSSF